MSWCQIVLQALDCIFKSLVASELVVGQLYLQNVCYSIDILHQPLPVAKFTFYFESNASSFQSNSSLYTVDAKFALNIL